MNGDCAAFRRRLGHFRTATSRLRIYSNATKCLDSTSEAKNV